MLFAYDSSGGTYVDQSGTSDIVTMGLGPELAYNPLGVNSNFGNVGGAYAMLLNEN